MSDNRRSSTRFAVSVPASLQIAGVTHDTEIKNLSLGGALIIHEDRLPNGTRVEVAFKLPGMADSIKVGGTVRWAAEFAIGIQFDGLRAKEVFALNQFFEGLPS